MGNGKWVTVKELCDTLGIGEKTARLMVKSGKLKKRMISPRMYHVWLSDEGLDGVVPAEGEKATNQPTVAPTDQPTAQPTEQDTELTELDRELADLKKEEEKLDRLTALAEKRLKLKTSLPWDEYQEKLKSLQEAEKNVLSEKSAIAMRASELTKRDSDISDMEKSLRGSLESMSSWWNTAGGLVWEIVKAVQAIQHESTYDDSNKQAYQPKGGGSYGHGTTPPEKELLVGNALRERWYDVFNVLEKIARLPEPVFHIDIHRSDVELLDAGDYDEEDEQEPDEQDEE